MTEVIRKTQTVHSRIAVQRLMSVLLLLTCFPVSAAAQVRSIQQFLALKPQWSSFAAIKQRLRVEGRVSSRSSTRLRFQSCDIAFVPAPGKRSFKIARTTRNLEISGYLKKTSRRYLFLVEKITAQQSDLQALEFQRVKLPVGKSQPRFALSAWVRARGTFYKDPALLKIADELQHEAVLLRRRTLDADDFEGLLKLVVEAKKLNLPPKLMDEWTHEAHRLRWQTVLAAKMPDFAGVTSALLKEWRDCKTPLKAEEAELSRNYAENPLKTYHKADALARKKLQRLFYRQILWEQIRRFARADGANGFAVAKRIELQIPERKTLAASYREKEMSYRLNHISSGNRNDAQDLAKLFHERKDPKRVTETWRRWLTAREPQRRKNGADGLIDLADEYVRLISDKKKAIELLKEADLLNPGTAEIARRMKQFGLYRDNNHWVTKKELKPAPVDPILQAIRDRRVIPGMSAAEVRRAMLGPPTSITRLASRRSFHEIWVYGKANESREAVHFLRKKSEPRTAARVIAVNSF